MPAESVLALMDRWTVVQAEACGVTGTRPTGTAWNARTLAQVAPGGWVRIIRPPAAVEPSETLQFARGEVGAHYGFLTIASTGLEIFTPDWLHVPIRRPGTWICSALGAEALRYGGWYHRWPDIYAVTPAQLATAVLASGGREIGIEDARPGDLGLAHSSGYIGAAIRMAQRFAHEEDWRLNHAFVLTSVVAPAG